MIYVQMDPSLSPRLTILKYILKEEITITNSKEQIFHDLSQH